MSETTFKPRLSLWDATMIVAGSMIGSGIFIVSADISRTVGSAGWLIGIWLITAFMTMCAATSYGELSGMFPKAGGQYIYLKEAFSPLTGFLYGWSLFAVIQTGTIAAVGVAFSKFTAYLIPAVSEDRILVDVGFLKVSPAQALSICIIVLLTFINTRGIQGGKRIQTSFTVIKISCLVGLIVFGFVMMRGEVWDANWTNAWDMHKINKDGSVTDYAGVAVIGAIASALAGSLFSSDAWNNVTFIAGEVKNPQRNLGLSLFFGTLIVAVVYSLTNIMYTAVLPMNEIAFALKDRVAVAASHYIFGDIGSVLIAVMIMISTFSCNNGLILSGARVYYAMAKDGLFFRKAGELNRFAVPQTALWVQCLLACVWCLSGRYSDLLDMVSFVVILFYVISILGIVVLRRKMPNAERPYKAFGYPWIASLYVLMGSAFCTFLIIYKPKFTWPGLIITLIGIPLYYFAVRNKKD
ncbi:MAG: amino acid transporter [Azospira oryzae]|nr:amino acid transporter [Cytophaga sp.]PZR39145.1 MAG: amino acid transporter [Azospira oryzae]